MKEHQRFGKNMNFGNIKNQANLVIYHYKKVPIKGVNMKKSIVFASYLLLFLLANFHSNAYSTPEEDFSEGYAFYTLKDYKQAFHWFRKAADQDHLDAQYNLGIMYDKGQGVLRDEKQAFYWYQKAANQGDAKAQYNLGVMYASGLGVLKDMKQAVHWFQKAADQGFTRAQFNLGEMNRLGEGVLKDYKQAVFWYKKSRRPRLCYGSI